MDKLGRSYELTVSSAGIGAFAPINIRLPFTIEFDITRNTLTSANVCKIRLYNLSPFNRNILKRSVISGWSNPLMNVDLKAGYGTQLGLIFSGNVTEAFSVREGVNYITQLECYDGGFSYVNSQISGQVSNWPKGTPYKTIITGLIGSLAPHVGFGAVGNYADVAPKQQTYDGNTIAVLERLTNGGFFIDNGKGYALQTNEYSIAKGPPLLIDVTAGLLNLPVVENQIVRFDMIFEPQLDIGSAVMLESADNIAFNSNFNGIYSITAIKHRGMISPSVCGVAITTGEFFFLAQPQGVA